MKRFQPTKLQTKRTAMKQIILMLVSAATACTANAAPIVSRLTPPSELFSSGDTNPPIIARFLPGQRFDLQATISPEPGKTITDAQFFVDGNIVSAPVS